MNTLRSTPSGEDPAFWPIHVLNEWNYLILNREHITNALKSALAEKAAPFRETIVKVKTAYEILAHPHCKQEQRRRSIEAELERDRQSFGRDHVELNDQELKILGKLAATKNITFDPHKRVYNYSEIPIAPHINPYGRRHMTTEQIQKWLSQSD